MAMWLLIILVCLMRLLLYSVILTDLLLMEGLILEVRLWRQSGTGTPAVGIYRCEVMDDTDTLQTVYVGLYNDDGGGNVLYV